jgi:hypothetical protein
MKIQRIIQPKPNTCWATSLAMLTGIDVDLFPLEQRLAIRYEPHRSFIKRAVEYRLSYRSVEPWAHLMDTLGYKLTVHASRPSMPHAEGFLLYNGGWRGHIIVVDENGTIIDSSGGSFIHGLKSEVLQDFCNLDFPKERFFTVEERA